MLIVFGLLVCLLSSYTLVTDKNLEVRRGPRWITWFSYPAKNPGRIHWRWPAGVQFGLGSLFIC
ncbi:MAG: hypothetical protein WAM30_12870, partial [Candidatus Dormiibacterota bacterium]